ncbi:MAG: hypothetical protein KJ726_08485 [Verrucomicrobia bacterium]|nr:hypothetical protein [Verrucomicrobiota bacterium]
MKKIFALVLITALFCGLAPASNGETESWLNEIAGGLVVQFPGTGDFDLYDIGFGAELQYRNWYFDPIGWAISAGYGTWEANKDCHKLGRIHTDFDGSVTTIPLGVSALFYLYGTQDFGLVLEAGLRYVIVDADVDFVREGTLPSTLTIDDGVLGLLALEADYYLNDQFLVFGGFGYQQDIVRGDIETPTGPLRDNEFTSLFLRLGGKFVF